MLKMDVYLRQKAREKFFSLPLQHEIQRRKVYASNTHMNGILTSKVLIWDFCYGFEKSTTIRLRHQSV